MYESICDRLEYPPDGILRAADLFCTNLKNALIDGNVRGSHRVQGLVLLRFFTECCSETALFDKLFFEYYLQTEKIL